MRHFIACNIKCRILISVMVILSSVLISDATPSLGRVQLSCQATRMDVLATDVHQSQGCAELDRRVFCVPSLKLLKFKAQ